MSVHPCSPIRRPQRLDPPPKLGGRHTARPSVGQGEQGELGAEGGGTYCVIKDPAGAVLALIQAGLAVTS